MNVGQLTYLIIDTYKVRNDKKCDGDYQDLDYVMYCNFMFIGLSYFIRATCFCLQCYYVLVVRQHWINKRDGRGDATLKYH